MELLRREYRGLHKVISGGQTGADQGGLIAAKIHNVRTGGTAPAKFMTTDGPMPELEALYGLTAEGTLQTRTKKNVKDSDVTLVISNNMKSPGTVLTVNACKQFGKPCIQLDTSDIGDTVGEPSPALVAVCRTIADELIKLRTGVLNVAGNRERYDDRRTTTQTAQIVGCVLRLLEQQNLLIHPL